MNIYVKNIPPNVSNNDLKVFFEVFGQVESAEVITNTRTGEAKDYAFVVMPVDEQGEDAITTLNGKEWLGKKLELQKARKQGGRRDGRKGGERRGDRQEFSRR